MAAASAAVAPGDIPEEHGMDNPKRNLQTW
jgi:hypothetical protein